MYRLRLGFTYVGQTRIAKLPSTNDGARRRLDQSNRGAEEDTAKNKIVPPPLAYWEYTTLARVSFFFLPVVEEPKGYHG
jgi:hypothetical protein